MEVNISSKTKDIVTEEYNDLMGVVKKDDDDDDKEEGDEDEEKEGIGFGRKSPGFGNRISRAFIRLTQSSSGDGDEEKGNNIELGNLWSFSKGSTHSPHTPSTTIGGERERNLSSTSYNPSTSSRRLSQETPIARFIDAAQQVRFLQ